MADYFFAFAQDALPQHLESSGWFQPPKPGARLAELAGSRWPKSGLNAIHRCLIAEATMPSKATLLFLLLSILAVAVPGQVTLHKGAVVYQGSASNTTAPATIDDEKVRDATPEWKQITDESIDVDSARGKQLLAKMNKRIREAVQAVATTESRDMVTRKRDIKDDQGRTVVDLTDKVVTKINE